MRWTPGGAAAQLPGRVVRDTVVRGTLAGAHGSGRRVASAGRSWRTARRRWQSTLLPAGPPDAIGPLAGPSPTRYPFRLHLKNRHPDVSQLIQGYPGITLTVTK